MTDGAITTVVTGFITVTTMVMGFLTMWLKLKYGDESKKAAIHKVEDKVDANTELTKAGTNTTVENARIAAIAATAASEKADALAKQMNGALDTRIGNVVEKHIAPLIEAFKKHGEVDEENMRQIHKALLDLKEKK